MTPEPVTSAELDDYVDRQLPRHRQFEVEHHLAQHPDQAAQVMAALSTRAALRLLHEPPQGEAADTQLIAAERLRAGLARRIAWPRGLRAAAVVVLAVAAGGLGAVLATSPGQERTEQPTIVAEAARAHQTALLRASMRSQPEATVYDPAEIRSATRIVLPPLPPAWRVADVQVFPSEKGPTVELSLSTREFGDASLFAARTTRFAVSEPTLVEGPDGPLVYWQIGQAAYALTGEGSGPDLIAAARGLSRSLH